MVDLLLESRGFRVVKRNLIQLTDGLELLDVISFDLISRGQIKWYKQRTVRKYIFCHYL